jgi:hypothetical protein
MISPNGGRRVKAGGMGTYIKDIKDSPGSNLIKNFNPSLIFGGEARADPRCSTLCGRLLALPVKTRPAPNVIKNKCS